MKKRYLLLAGAVGIASALVSSRADASGGWQCKVTTEKCWFDCDTGGPGGPGTEHWCWMDGTWAYIPEG